MSTSFGVFIYCSAVCMHTVHSPSLLLSGPSCNSECFSRYSDHLCRTYSSLLTMLPSLSLISSVCGLISYTVHFLIKFLCWIVIISNFHLLQLDLNNTLLFYVCVNIYCALFLALYSCSFCVVFLLLFCSKLSCYLLTLFDILHQSSSFFVVFLPFQLFFQQLPLFLFFFHILFVSSTSLNWVFCIFSVTYLMNSSFTSFSFRLPISHFFISLFLVFSLLIIFNLILTFTKNGLILIQQLSYFSHHKHFYIVFCRPIFDVSGYIFCHQVITGWPCECPYVVTVASNFDPPPPPSSYISISVHLNIVQEY